MNIDIEKELLRIDREFKNLQEAINTTRQRLNNLVDEQKKLFGERRFLIKRGQELGLIDEEENLIIKEE